MTQQHGSTKHETNSQQFMKSVSKWLESLAIRSDIAEISIEV